MSAQAPSLESPYGDAETVLRLVRSALERGNKAEVGSDEALQEIENVIAFVTGHFREHIRAAFPRANDDQLFQADAERALGLFTGAHGFLGEMALELRYAFAGLQIGDVRSSVKPRSRRGGVTNLENLLFKSIIVGAADRLKAKGGGDAAYRAELAQRGLNSRSVSTYRRQIARAQRVNPPAKFMNDAQMDEFVRWARERLNLA